MTPDLKDKNTGISYDSQLEKLGGFRVMATPRYRILVLLSVQFNNELAFIT